MTDVHPNRRTVLATTGALVTTGVCGLMSPAAAQTIAATRSMRGGSNNYRPGAPIVERIGGGGFWMTGTAAIGVSPTHLYRGQFCWRDRNGPIGDTGPLAQRRVFRDRRPGWATGAPDHGRFGAGSCRHPLDHEPAGCDRRAYVFLTDTIFNLGRIGDVGRDCHRRFGRPAQKGQSACLAKRAYHFGDHHRGDHHFACDFH